MKTNLLLRPLIAVAIPAGFLIAGVAGCASKIESDVILESTVDQKIAAPILSAFHRAEQKLVQPTATFSANASDRDSFAKQLAGKPGLATADVIWTDDVLLVIDLQRRGLLTPRAWSLEPTFPRELRATDESWCGFASVARVLLVNTNRLPDAKDHPQSIEELVDPRWKNRCAMAMPTSGTTAIHAAVIGQAIGLEKANEWFTKVAANATILRSNSAVAIAVANGQFDWGLTDSSDAVLEQDANNPVAVVFPDQATSQFGTLRIPNAVAVLKDAPHPIAAGKLADYLVLATTEERLAMSDAAQIPISRSTTFKPRVLPETPVRWATVDFEKAEQIWQSLRPNLLTIFASSTEEQ